MLFWKGEYHGRDDLKIVRENICLDGDPEIDIR